MLLTALLLAFPFIATAQVKPEPPPITISGSGDVSISSSPFRITVSPDTKMGLWYNGGLQFFGANASGLFLWIGSVAYGPSSIPAGNTYAAYIPISNTLSGSGTAESPWTITTIVAVGTTGVRLESTTRYINGRNEIDMTTRIINEDVQTQTLTLFHAGDLYLQFPGNQPDFGYGTRRASTGAIGATTSSGDRAFLFEPIEPVASAYQEAFYRTIWNAIGRNGERGTGFNNTFRTDYHDAAAGLQWNLTVQPESTIIIKHRLRLENVDLRPFDPQIDAPDVPNWVDKTSLIWEDFRETYGREVVESCNAQGEQCQRIPEAVQYYDKNFATTGEGGHCYGLSVMSTLFYRNIFAAQQFDANVTKTYDLKHGNRALRRQVAIFHTFQFSEHIHDEINKRHRMSTPNTVLNAIQNAVGSGNLDPLILIMKGKVPNTRFWEWSFSLLRDAGHAVVPYRVEARENNVYRIYVYDPNYPGKSDRFVTFEQNSNRWSYNHAPLINITWQGGQNDRTIAVIPMSLHTGQRPAPPFRRNTSRITMAERIGAARILITDRYGRRLGSDQQHQYDEVPGATANVVYAGDPGGFIYGLPSEEYTVQVSSLVTETFVTDLDIYGAGYALRIASLDLNPASFDTLILNRSVSHITYRSNDPAKEVDLSTAYSRGDGDAFSGARLTIAGIDVSDAGTLALQIDRNRDAATFDNATGGMVNLLVTVTNREGETVFRHYGLMLEANVGYRLDYQNTSTSGTVRLEIDRNRDGAPDEVRILNNQFILHLPIITR